MSRAALRSGLVLLLVLLLGGAAGQTDPVDQGALIAIWNGFTFKGDLKWDTQKSLCWQTGVTCSVINNQVTQLSLAHRKLRGTIATEVGLMTGLKELFLSSNTLTGTIPTEIGTMSGLTKLFLGSNNLTGTIPTEIGALSGLVDLELMEMLTSLTGTVPTEIGSLKNLERFYIRKNGLTGTIPTQIGLLSKLSIMYFEENQLEGTIPTEIGTMAALSNLGLTKNRLTGTIPTQVAMLSKMNSFRVDQNSLYGTIPSVLSTFNLQYLYLLNNYFCPVPNYRFWASIHDHYPPFQCFNGQACAESGCNCSQGFSSPYCFDINECDEDPCDPNAVCNNTVGSFTCTCEPGYTGSGITCEDIDECSTGVCSPYAICTNTVGSYSCSCPGGFEGNGTVCQDIDECAGGSHGCAGIAVCSNSPGSYSCDCPVGYTMNGAICQDENECDAGTHACHEHATCTNTPGSYSCACSEGYEGNGRDCNVIQCEATTEGNAAWPTTGPLETASGACQQGFSGAPTRLCNASGIFEQIQNPCTALQCQAALEGNAQWPTANAFETVYGECREGFSGTPFRVCNASGIFQNIQGICAATMCGTGVEGNAIWYPAYPLSTVNGICMSGFSGSPTRTCNPSGVWSAVVDPCTPIQCSAEVAGFASWPLTNASSTAIGTCRPNYTGTPTRNCSDAGQWLAVQSPCTRPASELPVVKVSVRLTNLDFQWYSSSEQNAQALLSSLITYFAQLLGVPESHVIIVSVTEGSVVVKFDVRTANPDEGKAKVEDFVQNPDLSFLAELPEDAKEDPSKEVGLDKTASSAQVAAAQEPTEAPAKGGSNTGAIVGGVIGGLIGVALLAAVAVLVAMKVKASRSESQKFNKSNFSMD